MTEAKSPDVKIENGKLLVRPMRQVFNFGGNHQLTRILTERWSGQETLSRCSEVFPALTLSKRQTGVWRLPDGEVQWIPSEGRMELFRALTFYPEFNW